MKKIRFTWLDTLLVVVLAIVVAVGVYLAMKPASTSESDASSEGTVGEYKITLRFNQVTNQENDGYQIGDMLYFQDRVAKIGKIKSIKALDKQSERFDPNNGEYVLMTDPEKKTIELTVLAEGILEKGNFTVDEQGLHIGKVFYPQSDTTRSTMTVWNIEEVAEK